MKKKTLNVLPNLVYVFFASFFVFCVCSIYFALNDALNDFVDKNIFYNFSSFAARTMPIIAKNNLTTAFLEVDWPLTTLAIISLFVMNIKNLKDKLILFAALITLYGSYKGFHLHYCLIYLPFYSIMISFLLSKSILYLKKNILLLAVVILFFVEIFQSYKIVFDTSMFRSILSKQVAELNWVIRNIPRSEIVFARNNNCPAMVFNEDHGYAWCWHSLSTVRKEDLSSFAMICGLVQQKYYDEIEKIPEIDNFFDEFAIDHQKTNMLINKKYAENFIGDEYK